MWQCLPVWVLCVGAVGMRWWGAWLLWLSCGMLSRLAQALPCLFGRVGACLAAWLPGCLAALTGVCGLHVLVWGRA